MIQSDPLTAIFILTYASLVISPVVFLFSMLDLGSAALWANIAIPPLTLAYHITILILHRRRARRTDHTTDKAHPTSTIASLVCAYLLATAWLVPLCVLVSVLAMWSSIDGQLSGVGNMGTVAVQLVLDAAELGILLAVAVISTRMRRRAHQWVPIDEV